MPVVSFLLTKNPNKTKQNKKNQPTTKKAEPNPSFLHRLYDTDAGDCHSVTAVSPPFLL